MGRKLELIKNKDNAINMEMMRKGLDTDGIVNDNTINMEMMRQEIEADALEDAIEMEVMREEFNAYGNASDDITNIKNMRKQRYIDGIAIGDVINMEREEVENDVDLTMEMRVEDIKAESMLEEKVLSEGRGMEEKESTDSFSYQ